METIKVKAEAIEVIEEDPDTDQMTVSHISLSRPNTSDSDYPPMIKQRKPLDWTLKRPSSLTHKSKQESSDDMEKYVSHKRKISLVDQFYHHLEAKSPVMERAKEIQAKLAPEFPTFIKTMLPSHVTHRFGIRFPKEFCYLHLPAHDTKVHLVDESGEEYIVNIHLERDGRCGLSGGWKKFTIANKLLDGDVLVFQLVNPSKFKVYIVKKNVRTKVKEEVIEVKEEVIEVIEEDPDTDQMTVSQFSLSRRNTSTSDYPPMWQIKQRKTLDWTLKRPSSLTHKSKQESSDDMEKSASHKRQRSLVDQFYDHLEAKSAMERAKEIQAKLAAEFPSFIKTMLASHVTHRFGIRFPKEFCYLHLPTYDTTVHLIVESGEEYIVNLHLESDGRCGLSGGWKLFSIANKLLERDVLVFQLVNPSKFKVYIVKTNVQTEGDGALGLLNLDAHANQSIIHERIVRPLPMTIVQEHIQQESQMIRKSNLADQSEIGSENIDSETSDFLVDFKEMGSIENFTIFLNGSINSELSEYHITKYYELCCTRNSFLHNHLLETVTCKLAAEIISQSVNIADAITTCKLSTSRAEYLTWDKTLEAFELLGMDVGFLRAKISRLLNLAFESKEAVDSKRFREAKIQQSCAKDEIRTLELKVLNLKDVVKKLDLEMETLKVNAERHELMFQEEVNAPL